LLKNSPVNGPPATIRLWAEHILLARMYFKLYAWRRCRPASYSVVAAWKSNHSQNLVDQVYSEALWWQSKNFISRVSSTDSLDAAARLIGTYKGDACYDISIDRFDTSSIQMKLVTRRSSSHALPFKVDYQRDGRGMLTILYNRDPMELGLEILAPLNLSFEVRDCDDCGTRMVRWGPNFVTTFHRDVR
jgi:hypothetical protein